jgi:hypothetical protein
MWDVSLAVEVMIACSYYQRAVVMANTNCSEVFMPSSIVPRSSHSLW